LATGAKDEPTRASGCREPSDGFACPNVRHGDVVAILLRVTISRNFDRATSSRGRFALSNEDPQREVKLFRDGCDLIWSGS
jgi:hypothetical protein